MVQHPWASRLDLLPQVLQAVLALNLHSTRWGCVLHCTEWHRCFHVEQCALKGAII